MSIPFLVAMCRNSKSWYRPTANAGGYFAGSTGGTLASGNSAYDFDTSATVDTTTAATITATSLNGTRTYAGTFDTFGTGTYTGTLKVYASLSATSDGGGVVTAAVQYSTDGSTYTDIVACNSDETGVPVDYAAAQYDVPLTSQNIANLKVRGSCDGYRVGILPDIFTGGSTCTIYDIVFVT